ncbi:hypothetical protein T08_15534 [Trichinella sp. T8]|nr:hypothetical protein T08_15534 [Trichinella sp. T8]
MLSPPLVCVHCNCTLAKVHWLAWEILMMAVTHAYLWSLCSHTQSFFPSLFTCLARRKLCVGVLFGFVRLG